MDKMFKCQINFSLLLKQIKAFLLICFCCDENLCACVNLYFCEFAGFIFWVRLTWNTVTVAQSRESKFFLSGKVSPVSWRKPNLQPNRCIPRILHRTHTKHINYSINQTSQTENKWTQCIGPGLKTCLTQTGAAAQQETHQSVTISY